MQDCVQVFLVVDTASMQQTVTDFDRYKRARFHPNHERMLAVDSRSRRGHSTRLLSGSREDCRASVGPQRRENQNRNYQSMRRDIPAATDPIAFIRESVGGSTEIPGDIICCDCNDHIEDTEL